MIENNLGKGENVIKSFLKDAIKEADKLYEEDKELKRRYELCKFRRANNLNYIHDLEKENEQLKYENKELKEENEQLKKDLIDHSALISMLEDYQALRIEETLWNLTGAKSEEEFNELYKPYLDKAKRSF